MRLPHTILSSTGILILWYFTFHGSNISGLPMGAPFGISVCGRYTLRWPQASVPLYNPFPSSVGCTCDLLITTRVWRRWWDVTPLIWLCHQTLSQLIRKRLTLLLAFEKASCLDVNCLWTGPHDGGLYYRLHVVAEDLSPTHTRNWSLLANTGADPKAQIRSQSSAHVFILACERTCSSHAKLLT